MPHMFAIWTLWQPFMVPLGIALLLLMLVALDLYARVLWHLGYKRGHRDATALALVNLRRTVEQGEKKLRETREECIGYTTNELAE